MIFFQALLLLQRKYYHSWYISSPIRDIIRVILTPALHAGSVASRIRIASINSSFIKYLLNIYQYGCQLKTKILSSALLTFSNHGLSTPYRKRRHNRIFRVDNDWICNLEISSGSSEKLIHTHLRSPALYSFCWKSRLLPWLQITLICKQPSSLYLNIVFLPWTPQPSASRLPPLKWFLT